MVVDKWVTYYKYFPGTLDFPIILHSFKDTLNLYDSFSETEINEKWSILDYILYRPGESINFEILNVGEDESFETHEGALSDHPALFIEFEIIKN